MNGTLSLVDAAEREWDAVVIGAGPAGCLAARGIAERNRSVLLVESKAFPRPKVCGGCLNENSLSTLREAGAMPYIDDLGPVPLTGFCLAAGGRNATLSLPGGVAVSRAAMDAALARAAVDSGAEFLPETTAAVGDVSEDCRSIRLESHGESRDVSARIVVAATGLSGRSLSRLEGFQSEEEADSRIGVEATISEFPAFYGPGVIFMAVASGGYVGLTRVEDGRLNVAAAVDAAAMRGAGGPAAACRQILEDVGFPYAKGMPEAEWRGTMKLTRRTARRAGERLFLVGDAAGYVEPFTGEGMAWALAGGSTVVPFVEKGLVDWRPDLAREWEQHYTRLIQNRQWMCRCLAQGLRRSWLVRTAVPALARMPWLARPIIARLNRDANKSRGESAAARLSTSSRIEAPH